MFGTLQPRTCGLPQEARDTYRTYYCGTCQSLGEQFSLLHRGLLSHDAVFLAMLVDGLTEHEAAPSSCRCPMMPIQIRRTRAPQSVSMRYAGAMQLLLADQWAADRALDGRKVAVVARRWTEQAAGDARATLRELGVPIDALDGFELRQKEVERAGVTGPEAAARPTAEALAFVFEHIADLPTVRAPRDALARLGAAIGRLIYVADALSDIEEDTLDGSFNPCFAEAPDGRPQLEPARVDEAAAMIERDAAQVEAALEALALERNEELLRSVLERRLIRDARREVDGARARLGEAERERLIALRDASWAYRAAYRVAALALFLWAWAQAQVAHAQTVFLQAGTPTPPGGTGGGGATTGGGATGAGADDTTSGGGGKLFDIDFERLNPCNNIQTPRCDCCSDCCNPCNDCCRSCGDCTNACNDCGNCCDGCGNCGNGCNCGNCNC